MNVNTGEIADLAELEGRVDAKDFAPLPDTMRVEEMAGLSSWTQGKRTSGYSTRRKECRRGCLGYRETNPNRQQVRAVQKIIKRKRINR